MMIELHAIGTSLPDEILAEIWAQQVGHANVVSHTVLIDTPDPTSEYFAYPSSCDRKIIQYTMRAGYSEMWYYEGHILRWIELGRPMPDMTKVKILPYKDLTKSLNP